MPILGLWLTLANATTGWVPVQGHLTDTDGAGVDGPRSITVRLLDDADLDGAPAAFYTEVATV